MSIRTQLLMQFLMLGLMVLAYLAARWWWLDRQFQKTQNANHLYPASDGASVRERIEPVMHANAALSSEQAFDAVAFPDLPSSVATIAERRGVLNATIDCIARMDLDEPCSGELALNLLPTTRRIGSKTWVIEGLSVRSEQWEKVVSSAGTPTQYSAFQAGIQLVNRNGALNEVEFSEFVVKAGEIAEGLGASLHLPEMLPEVTRARELEQFTMGHDIRLTLNLHAKRVAWSLPYVQQHVQRAGFVAGVIPGRWVLGGARFDMVALTIDSHAALADDVSAEPIHQMALTLDVPQVARGEGTDRPFDVMCDVAIRLCASMEAAILDEQGLVVDVAALQRTSDELEAVYDRLDAAGLPAGSALAKRLFS